MDDVTVVKKAEELGLTLLFKQQPADLIKAIDNAQALVGQLPQDLHWTEEPAHVFVASPSKEADT